MVIEESLEVAVRRPRNMEPTCFPSPGKVLRNCTVEEAFCQFKMHSEASIHKCSLASCSGVWRSKGLQVSLSWFGGQL